MDILIVAAAAGAGYIAKHWQNLLRDRQSFSESSSGSSNFVEAESQPLIRQLCDKSCPFHRLAQSKILGENAFTEREQVSQGTSTAEVASTSGFEGEKLVNSGDCNIFARSSLLPGFLRNQDIQEDGEGVRVSGDIGENSSDLLPKPCTSEMRSAYGSARNRSALRNGRTNGKFIKPLSSLESCLVAQLYREHVEMEEYIRSFIPSPSTPTVRPFFVTDGSRIISRASGDTVSLPIGTGESKLHKKAYSEVNGTVFGLPPLPNVGSKVLLRKMKVKTGKERGGRLSSKMINGKHFNSQGSSHGALLFCLGISVGIISSFLANKREVDKLNELLKQTENLVQDLQEELEMKDSLTVKELAIEDYESQDTHEYSYNNRAPHAFSPEQNFDTSTKCDHKELHDQKAEYSESLGKIEAELEAELERLELNMNSSNLGGLSDLVELDPDIVQGELRTDMFGRQAGAQPCADRDESGTSTTNSANYVVSPRELSLRLHEVLRSRLEERVKELETALQNSQRKVQDMESERVNFWKDFSISEVGSSSILGSPIAEKERDPIDQPVVINLSGEVLDAYNEISDEFTKIDESEEEDLPSGVGKNSHQQGLHPFDLNLYQVQNGEGNHYMPCHTITNGKPSTTFIPRRGEEHTSPNAVGVDGDQSDNGHDEMEKLLIKQIVEKTRKGSPVVLNAQRALFSMDEQEF